MATHCSVLVCFRGTWRRGSILLVCFRGTWWWGSIHLVCFRWTWGRSIPFTLMWFTALKQFGGQQDIISWEFLCGYWRRRGAFRFKWTVRKGCRIHTDGGSAWRDNIRLEWTHSCILRHNNYGNISLEHESDLTATSSLHFLLWYIFGTRIEWIALQYPQWIGSLEYTKIVVCFWNLCQRLGKWQSECRDNDDDTERVLVAVARVPFGCKRKVPIYDLILYWEMSSRLL